MKTYIIFLLNIFFKSFLKVFLILMTLIMIINIFEEIEFFKTINVHFLYPVFLSALNTPSIIFEILPFIFLISAQVFFIKLIDNNELQIFKYTGLTNLKILKIVSLFSFFLGLILVIFFYNISSKLKNQYLEIKNNYSNDNKYLAVITENGLWIKDEIDNKINIVNASKIDENFLLDVLIVEFDSDYNYRRTIQSKVVDISKKLWFLNKANITVDNVTTNSDDLFLNSNFDLKKINSLFSNLSSLTIWNLFKLRKDYENLNYSITEIDGHIHKLFSYPIYLTIMTVLSGIIMLNIKYLKNSIFKIIFGILISVLIYYINFFFNALGVNEKVPIVFSVWLPLIMLSLINLIFIVRINEK
tara:strand:+ start:393 stop:1466 length:1074 start_codon:yes stop_codon:yes gene_type:complete